MSKKREQIDYESIEIFASALEALSRQLNSLLEMASREEPPEYMYSRNFPTGVRGLDYVERFIGGLALQAVETASPRKVIEVLKLDVDDPREIILALEPGEEVPTDAAEIEKLRERQKSKRAFNIKNREDRERRLLMASESEENYADDGSGEAEPQTGETWEQDEGE